MFHLLIISYTLKCQENEIENCIKCETGDNSDKCSICQEKYFLALNGEVCIKCDDPHYGMVGCSGTCILMKENSNVKCQEDSCKTGFYELTPGYCAICSLTDPNCNECQYLKNINEFKCLKCRDYYFPNEDGICERCEMENCKKCSNKNFCLECEEGYTAYPDGICHSNIENCKIGVYSKEKNSPICIECNNYYYVDSDGLCKECEKPHMFVSCHKCHLDNGKVKCDEGTLYFGCSNISKLGSCRFCSYKDGDFRCNECEKSSYYKMYINDNGECSICNSDSERGYCSVCSDDPKAPCDSCSDDSALIEDKCIKCNNYFENKCAKCSEKICLKCYGGYGFLYEEGCSDCSTLFGKGCLNCGLNPYDGKPYCAECRYNYFFGNDGKCKNCEEDGNLAHCQKCEELGKKGFICTSCNNGYTLEDGKCFNYCNSYQILGNDGECKSCSSDEIGLSNCNKCKKLKNGKFECIECLYDYNLVNGKCVKIEEEEIKICNEIENISTEETPIFSCINCPENNNYFQIIKENGAKICLKKSEYQELNNCESVSVFYEGEKNYICNKCANNSELVFDDTLQKYICKCIDGFFFDSSKQICRKCSELDSGCLKCEVTMNYNGDYYMNCNKCEKYYVRDNNGFCSYCNYYCSECIINENLEKICIKYKEPYFLSNTSEIKLCTDYFKNCAACSYIDEEKSELKCDKCLDNYYKNKNEECVECYENININSGCLICTDNEEKLKNIKCDKCKVNYFMTRENICEFCLSEKNGGDNCEVCDYIKTEKDEEKIGCVKCLNPEYILLNGKCYAPIDNCKKYESYSNVNNEIKIRCKECIDKYELNQFYRCNKIKVKIPYCIKTNEDKENPKCLECEDGFDLAESKCIEKIESGNDEIDGCLKYESKYGYNYCTSCNNNYFLRMGNCIEKYKSNYFDNCQDYRFKNGIFECLFCGGSKITVSNLILCNADIFSRCDEIINLGPETRPIFSCNKCFYYDLLVEDENGIKTCAQNNIFNERCIEGKKNTYYYNDIYTCTKCKEPYILSYSEFYERKICKDIYEEEKKSEFTIKDYESDKGTPTVNGKCDNGYFTRNGKVCIKCDDIDLGMPGCSGKCDFKINRECQLKCEANKCKEGYFEVLPGQCELCKNKINGCNKCEYVENNEKKYIMLEPIRKRELLCIDIGECQGENIFKINNLCLKCSDIFNNCLECIKDNDIIKCKKAQIGYYIDMKGKVIKCPDNCSKCESVNENDKFKVKCLKESNSYYFVNNEGQLKKCDDYYDGIPNCSSCSYYNNILKCYFCEYGFKEVNGSCYSCEEILDNKGCKNCVDNYTDNSIYCNYCKDNYILISNLGKCIPKNDEIKYCSKANIISKNGDNFYNCTSCDDYYILAKDLKNRTNCYYKYGISESFDGCSVLINLNTKLNPVLSCEKCQYYYTIIIDENQIQTCKNADNDLQFCSKGMKITIFDEKNQNYKDVYNCTECMHNYELEYNNDTNKFKCKAIKCFAPNCKLCKENELYICKECKSGYVFSKFNDCIIKPKIIPNVYFKDIYRFALNGNNKINGEYIFGPIYTIRGLTKEDITEMHSFIILSIFKLENGVRNLEEKKQFKTYCKYKDKVVSSETILKLVDYECIVDSEYQYLSNYKLIEVDENQYSDSENLNAFDLENLVSKGQDLSKYQSSYDLSDLDKYIYFNIDDNINYKFKTNSTDKFRFSIKGKTDKSISENIQGELKIHEKNDIKANCNVDIKNKDDATLNCEINLGTIINKNSDEVLTFEDDEILSEKNNVLFSGIKKIKIFKLKIIEEVSPFEENKKNEKDNNSSLAIGLSIGLGVPILAVIIFFTIYFCKKKKGEIKNDNINSEVKIVKKGEATFQSERN